jgi:hypothetical protein
MNFIFNYFAKKRIEKLYKKAEQQMEAERQYHDISVIKLPKIIYPPAEKLSFNQLSAIRLLQKGDLWAFNNFCDHTKLSPEERQQCKDNIQMNELPN